MRGEYSILRRAGTEWCYLPWTLLAIGSLAAQTNEQAPFVLQPADFQHHVDYFNAMEDENVTNCISNSDSWDWLQDNVPFFECPDPSVERIYYYRWWSFRKHL
jgi:hypothetical protein